MATVSITYHTDSDEYPPEHRSVYHERKDCPVGKLFPRSLMSGGTGGKERCKNCVNMDRQATSATLSSRFGK